jgi:glycosyltransferase involved in cell wall biosynthesis
MKILYIHQYFKTPEEGGAIRSYYLAKGLVDAGHEVELITTHNLKTKQIKIIDGIRVHYLPIPYQNGFGFLKRIKSFLVFAIAAYRESCRISLPDISYITSTPLTVGLTALALKKIKKIPYIFEVRDLWPEAPIQMGVLNNYFLRKAFQMLEKKTYQYASGIVALSPGILAGIEKTILKSNTLLIPNISDCAYFNITPPKNKPIFTVSYFGAIGTVNHLEALIEIAKQCKTTLPNVEFLIAGEGGQVASVKNAIAQYNLTNLKYLGFLNKEGIKELLQKTDAVYISFASLPILETNSPNKFFDSIAAGKLTIVNTNGWIKETIEKENCGIYVNPNNPEEFINKLLPYIENPILLQEAQNKARILAETQFSREMLVEKLEKYITKIHQEYQ